MDTQPRKLPPLEPPDSHYLLAASGWLDLGDHLEANEELERIATNLRNHPHVLELRWQIYSKAGKWEACVDLAEVMIKLDRVNLLPRIHLSYAFHELKRTQEAFDQLLPMSERFPKEWIVPYNLACYCAQLGRLEESAAWFKMAKELDEKTSKRQGMDDPDLKPLWDSMGGKKWK